MDWSAFPFLEYFPSERFTKWEDWKLYYLDVREVLQMNEDQAMASVLCLLSGWALQAVSDLPFRFWLTVPGEVVMSLGQYLDIIEVRLSLSRGENCDHTDCVRSRKASVIEEKVESENGQAGGRMNASLSENSEEHFELCEVGSELVRTGCSNQDKAMRNFQNVVDLLQLSGEQAEQLGLSMLGELNGEKRVGIMYRNDQRTRQEIIVIPSEWLETNIPSTEIKESIKSFVDEACRGKENVCNRVEQNKKFCEEKKLGDSGLQSRRDKEEEERQRREKMIQIDMESKKQRRLQEESRKKFSSKLEKVVTPEGFEYYVDRCSDYVANNGGDDCLFMSDSDYKGSDDEETELPHEFFRTY